MRTKLIRSESSFHSSRNFDETQNECTRSKFGGMLVKLLMPNSAFRLSWELFIFLAIWYNSVLPPVRLFVIGFERTPTALISIDVVLDFVFMIDTILNFYRPFIDKDTMKVVKDITQIRKRYLNSFAFYTNTIACIPILKTLLAPFLHVKTNRLLSTNSNILRMIRIFHFPAQFHELKVFLSRKNPVNESIFRMGIILFFTQLLMCILASVYFGVGAMATPDICPGIDYFDQEIKSKEIWIAKDSVILSVMSPSRCHSDESSVCSDCPQSLFFVRSMYFLMQTLFTIGYGDNVVPSRRLGEICIACVFMILGVFGYGLTISNMTSVISNIDVVSMRFRHEMDSINKWLSLRSVPETLRERVDMHFHYIGKTQSGMLDKVILNELPLKLSTEISDTHIDLLSKVPFFNPSFRTKSFLSKVAALLDRRIYPPGSQILYEGEKQRDLILVKKGRVEIYLKDEKDAIATLIDGDFIGDYQLIFGTVNQVGVRSPDFAEVLVLTFDAFERIMDHPSQRYIKFRELGCNLRLSDDQGVSDTLVQTKLFMNNLATKLGHLQTKARSKKLLDLMEEGDIKMKGFRISPNSKIHVYWDIFALLTIMYNALSFPILLSSFIRSGTVKDGYSYAFIVNYVIDIMFLLDMNLRMTVYAYTTFESGRNVTVVDSELIKKNYKKSSWFHVDRVANIPYDIFGIFVGYHSLFRIPKLYRITQIPMLISRLRRNLDECFHITVNETQSSGVIMFLSSLFIIIWSSSGWYSMRSEESGLKAVYWALTTLTTVGYGDLTPSDLRETCYAIIIGAVGATFTAGIIANVTSFFHDADVSTENLEHKFFCSKRFLEAHSRPAEQVKRIEEYFDYLDREQEGVNEDMILKKYLPSHIKGSLVVFITSPMILNCELFSCCEAGFQRRLMTSLERHFFGSGTFILDRSIPSNGMYFVKKGRVELYQDLKSGIKKVIKIVGVDEFFAEDCLLEHWDQNPYLAESITDCEIWHLRRTVFNRILDDFPHVRVQFKRSTQNSSKQIGRRGSINSTVRVFQNLKLKHHFYIHPDEYFIQFWFGLVLLITLYSVISLPFRVAFLENHEISRGWLGLDYLGDLIFAIDIFIRSHFLAYYDPDNHLITSRKDIWRHYISSGKLKWHIMSIFPAEIIISRYPSFCPFWKLQVWSLFRLNKLFRLFEVPTLLHQVESSLIEIGFRVPKNPLRLIKLFMVIMLTGHYAACIFFSIANLNEFYGSVDISNNWGRDEGIFVDRLSCPGFPLIWNSVLHRYIASLYWAIATLTTVGYGDISANGNSSFEIIFSTMMLIVGTGIYTLVIASLDDIVSQLDVTSSLHKVRTDKANKFAKLDAIPESLKSRIDAYYENLWNKQLGVRGEQLINFFPRSFKNEMLLEMLSPLLQKTFFIKDCTTDFVTMIVDFMRQELFLPDDTLFVEGEKCDSLFYIYKGTVDLMTSSLVKFKSETNCVLGEVSFFGLEPYLCTAKAADTCEVFTLSFDDFASCVHSCHIISEFAAYIDVNNGMLRDLRSSLTKMTNNLNSSKMGKMIFTTSKIKASTRIILPDMTFRLIWDLSCFLCTIISAFRIPYQYSFSRRGITLNSFLVDVCIDVFFVLDLVLRLQYFAIMKDGVVIDDVNEFRKFYIQNDFMNDFISSMPISAIVYLSGSRGTTYTICRLLQLLRIRQFGIYINTLVESVNSRTRFNILTSTLRMVQIFFLVLFMCHSFACIYHYLGDINDGSWLLADNSIGETKLVLYVRSFYWALYTVTTIGYGSIPVVTKAERVFAMIAMATGAVICDAGIAAILTSIISMRDQQSGTNRRRIHCAKLFMTSNLINNDTQDRVMDYYKYVDNELGNIMEDDVLNNLPQNLKTDIIKHFCIETFQSHMLFRNKPNGFMYSILKILEPYLAVPGEKLSIANEESDYIYILKRGVASSVDETGFQENLLFGSIIGHYITKQLYESFGSPDKVLEIGIIKGKGFKVKYGNPYLTVAVGSRKCRTAIQSSKVWNEKVSMKIQGPHEDCVTFRVMSWQKSQLHTELGTVSMPLSTCNSVDTVHHLLFKDTQGKIQGSLYANIYLRELKSHEICRSHELTTTSLSYCHLYRMEKYQLEEVYNYYERAQNSSVSNRVHNLFREFQPHDNLTDKDRISHGYRRPSRPYISYSTEQNVSNVLPIYNSSGDGPVFQDSKRMNDSIIPKTKSYRTSIYPSGDESDPENVQEESVCTKWSGSTKVRTETLLLPNHRSVTDMEEEDPLDGFSEYDKHWDQVVDFPNASTKSTRRRTLVLEW